MATRTGESAAASRYGVSMATVITAAAAKVVRPVAVADQAHLRPPLSTTVTPEPAQLVGEPRGRPSRPFAAVTRTGPVTSGPAHGPRSTVTAAAATASAAAWCGGEFTPRPAGGWVAASRYRRVEHPGGRLDQPGPRQPAAGQRVEQPLLGRGQVGRHEQQVVAGQQGPDRRLARRPRLAGAMFSASVIDHAAEAELAAQQVDQHLAGEARRHARVDRGHVEVAGHDQPGAGVDAGLERRQVAGGQRGQASGPARAMPRGC